AAGRTILVPLSAGLDSRLVVSGLAHLGHRNVKCFAYGLPGNYEAEASRRIAAHLGFDWRFVRFTLKQQRAYFASRLHRDYVSFADSCCSTPVWHDLPAVYSLCEQGYIPDDAIVVNGNSGDYISGLHIVPPLRRPRRDLDAEERQAVILNAVIEKHFRLWESLGTPENDGVIRALLAREMALNGLHTDDPDSAHGVYEFLEFQDRQSKYVIARQRVYEFLGLEWRLPLWDNDYLDFWQAVPLSAKAEQRLYRDILVDRNWGGIWDGPAWTFPRRVSPGWIRLPRHLLKAVHAPFGQKRWHRFDRRYLSYWMDLMAGQALVPYSTVAADRRGARHFVSWHTEAYLRDKGLRFDGLPL
ncbi:MAG: asparagine synthase, partial [Proteobacteria bacterium]|nr:asparagine synthase [Pseudomonadota bacterium]